jgi:hypothetical protein
MKIIKNTNVIDNAIQITKLLIINN